MQSCCKNCRQSSTWWMLCICLLINVAHLFNEKHQLHLYPSVCSVMFIFWLSHCGCVICTVSGPLPQWHSLTVLPLLHIENNIWIISVLQNCLHIVASVVHKVFTVSTVGLWFRVHQACHVWNIWSPIPVLLRSSCVSCWTPVKNCYHREPSVLNCSGRSTGETRCVCVCVHIFMIIM